MHNDIKEQNIFGVFILLPLLVEFIAVLTRGDNKVYTILLNLLVFCMSIYLLRKTINFKDCIILVSFYLFFFFNYFLFKSGRPYYFETSMLLVYCIHLPISIFCIRKIRNWDTLFLTLKPYCYIATFISIYIVFFGEISAYKEWFSYMEFSYNVIPFIGCTWILFRKEKINNQLLCCILMIVCVFLYGSRAALFFVLSFLLLFEVFAMKKGVIFILIPILIFCSFNLLQSNNINIISDNSIVENSYIFQRFEAGKLFESDGRDYIYNKSLYRLSIMNNEIDGLFGDRQYNNGVWPHNIFLEILMQFGWIIGFICCTFYIILLLKSLFFNRYFVVSLFMITLLLGRYWISGSYVIEGRFWYALFSLMTIVKYDRILNRNKFMVNVQK